MFKTIDLPIVTNLNEEFELICRENDILDPRQVCINDVKENSDDIFNGAGSLIKVWTGKRGGKPIDNPYGEEDFKYITNQFKDTTFEYLWKEASKRYNIGRARIFISNPGTCLTWHKDDTDRIHYPFKTLPGCIMAIEDQAKHLELNRWYYTKTKGRQHTAANASYETRMHLVFSVIG